MFIKRFIQWNKIKKQLDSTTHKSPFIREGEIWWCAVGENVGVEVNGKGEYFTRPVVILLKYNQHSFLGIPITTTSRTGKWYALFTFKSTAQTAMLSQVRTFSTNRLDKRMGELHAPQYKIIKDAFARLLSK